ncbi:beta-lactamase superfamily domain-containing protein [Pilobolus umbonatus]|nr:beta-lactamase superfamily domain-containing protein [Pilobolus umbonatus]
MAHSQGKKAHHEGKGFANPWPSFVNRGLGTFPRMLNELELSKPLKEATPSDMPAKVELDWNRIRREIEDNEETIEATWLGHACALVRINGFNILLDPVFSERCSPVQFVGPKRYTAPPCQLKDLPRIDAVVISHNHYDHLDSNSIKELETLHPECKFYVPLGNKAWFKLSKPLNTRGEERVTELDWWDESILQRYNGDGHVTAELKLTCTPCQHFSGRGLLDRNKTLWASWAIEGWVNQSSKGKVFFGGDTGYRTVPQTATKEQFHDLEYLDTLPHCPVFKEIGEKFGHFDLALIPIGAYSPRWFMSPIHCSPEDSVSIHQDIKSKHSIGVHWGTFVLTDESVSEPPHLLKRVMEKRGLNTEDFNVLPLGGTYSTTISLN